jgi:TolB-like protein/tetratricopeptide (TPR) repeat protein
MPESAPQGDASPPHPVVKTAANRWAKLAAQLKRFRGPIAAVAAFGAILSGLLGYWSAYQTVENIVVPKSSTPASGPPLLSVAVMPFVPATGSADDGRFAERMTQDVTSSLERNARYARVVSHGLMAKYQDKPTDPRTLGRELNVRYLVEGDVRTDNGATMVMARLVDTASGTTVSSARIAEQTSGHSDGKADLVAQLSNRIRGMLYDAEEARVARLPTSGASAMELVLHADRIGDQDPSPKGTLEARKLYEEALRRDPDSVPALLGLYNAKRWDFFVKVSPAPDQVVKELDELSKRALSLDRSDPRVWRLRADALMYQQQWDRALEANAAALQIDPYSNATVGDRGMWLLLTGQPAEALPVLDRAIALDPTGPDVGYCLQLQCSAHLNLGHYDQAIAACEKALALDDFWLKYLFLLGAYAQKGDMAKAEAVKVELLNRKPDVSIARLKNGPQVWANPLYQQQREAHLYAGLRKAGIPEQ